MRVLRNHLCYAHGTHSPEIVLSNRDALSHIKIAIMIIVFVTIVALGMVFSAYWNSRW
jgi:hypothetical protein